MHFLKLAGLFSVLFFTTLSCYSEIINSTFNATSDWKTVEEGQAIPAGLHVRINLQTGKKEAKLLDETNEEKRNIEEGQTSSLNIIKPDELEKLVKKIKGEENNELKDETKTKFRSYEEIKSDFESLQMKVKRDVEIMHSLFDSFKKFSEDRTTKAKPDNVDHVIDEELLTILKDLEYLVHQYDNAVEFARLNGFGDIVHKSLNSSNEKIRSEALKLHGSATQSNPKVQIAALESGSMGILLKTLALDKDTIVKTRSVFALSCLLRGFPSAQQKMLHEGGLSVFATIFDKDNEDLFSLQLKIITLLYDLINEREETKTSLGEENVRNITETKFLELKEKMNQYKKVDLEKKLVEQNWCIRISKWFLQLNLERTTDDMKIDYTSAISKLKPIRNQHDVIEKVVDAIVMMSDMCSKPFCGQINFINLLHQLKDVYVDLAAKENSLITDSNDYFSNIAVTLKKLTDKLRPPTKLKEEL